MGGIPMSLWWVVMSYGSTLIRKLRIRWCTVSHLLLRPVLIVPLNLPMKEGAVVVAVVKMARTKKKVVIITKMPTIGLYALALLQLRQRPLLTSIRKKIFGTLSRPSWHVQALSVFSPGSLVMQRNLSRMLASP